MNTQTRKDILTRIMADMKHDAATLDGQPFNGHVTAQIFDRLVAAFSALVDVATASEEEVAYLKKEIAELKRNTAPEKENVEMGCFCDLEPDERPGKCVWEEAQGGFCIYLRALKKTGKCVYLRPTSEWEDKQEES